MKQILHSRVCSYTPLRGFQAVVDTALESSVEALSNAVSTSAWKPRSDEWLAFKSELEAAGINVVHDPEVRDPQ